MSDSRYLKDTPAISLGALATNTKVVVVDPNDEDKTKLSPLSDISSKVLGGKAIGGPGSDDIVTNSSLEALLPALLPGLFQTLFSASINAPYAGKICVARLGVPEGHGGRHTLTEETILTMAGLSTAERAEYAVDPAKVAVHVYLNYDPGVLLVPVYPAEGGLQITLNEDGGVLTDISFSGLASDEHAFTVFFALKER